MSDISVAPNGGGGEKTPQMKEYERSEKMLRGILGEVFTIIDAAYGYDGSTMNFSSTTAITVKPKSEAVKDLIKQTVWRRLDEYAKLYLGAVELGDKSHL